MSAGQKPGVYGVLSSVNNRIANIIHKKDKKLLLAAVCVFVLLIASASVIAAVVFSRGNQPVTAPSADPEVQLSLLSDVSTSEVMISEYYIYGNHLHLEGEFDGTKYHDFSRVGLVLRKDDGTEKEITLDFSSNNFGTVFFASSEYINGGICLDELAEGDFCVLFKIVDGDKKIYTSAAALRDFDAVNYYTVTKNGGNRLVNLGFTAYSTGSGILPCLAIKIEKTALPADVYDIVIDAGHGGGDSGAVYKGHNEADLTIDYAKALKKELEALGLKVRMTREGNEKSGTMTGSAAYNKDGRVERACLSGAKYCFAVHFNSVSGNKRTNAHGFQIYCPYGADISFAQSIADSVVKNAGARYSPQEFSRVAPGVYIRTFGKKGIEDSKKVAKQYGYKPYETLKENTTFYYMIRETGGVATGAYIDGRSSEFNHNENESRNSVTGLESYLLEIGYICNEDDLANILNNRDAYAKAIAAAIAKELGITAK